MFQPQDVLTMVLADGSAIMRAGIKRLLAAAPEIQIVEECADSEAAKAAVDRFQPDFLLTAFRLEESSGVEALRYCRLLKRRPLCVVYTSETAASVRAISRAAGADIFYDHARDMEPLLSTLRKIAASLLCSPADLIAG